MKIEINTENLTYFDLYLLSKLVKLMEEHAGVREGMEEAAQSSAPEAAPEPKKRGKRKADHLTVVETEQPSAPEEPPPVVIEDFPATVEQPTLDDMRKTLQEFAKVNGVPASVALLKKYGASRISDLDPQHYVAVKLECVKAECEP